MSDTPTHAAGAVGREAGWQPISTAPKDGTPVLICDFGEIVVARYEDDWEYEYCRWRGTYGDGDATWSPTHWMPLPEIPAECSAQMSAALQHLRDAK